MIPNDKIQTIRERAADNIVEIIGDYVKLDRSNKGLCPFHDEKTASFNVTPKMGIYKCFGCGEGGDAIDFLMKQEGWDFMEAVKQLARRFHIDISDGNQNKRRNSGKSTPFFPFWGHRREASIVNREWPAAGNRQTGFNATATIQHSISPTPPLINRACAAGTQRSRATEALQSHTMSGGRHHFWHGRKAAQ